MDETFSPAGNRDTAIPEFYLKPVHMTAKSEAEGRQIYEEMEYVRILVPGDSKSLVDEKVKDHHRDRWPTQYARFKNNQLAPEDGMPLDLWPAIGPAQVMELRAAHVRTVEALAGLSDAQLQKVCPMGGFALRQKALNWLEAAKGNAPTAALEKALAERDETISALQAQVADMAAKFDAMLSRKDAA
jgi:hypothetical protein